MHDGLRVCAARIGRAMYALRNKRNILHKGDVDPNSYDLRFLYHASQWVMAELIRSVSRLSMEECGRPVEFVQAPAGGLVEDFGDRRLVLEAMPTKEELLVLLHTHYPEAVATKQIVLSLDRRSEKTVRNALRTLWASKLVEGSGRTGYRLTKRGFDAAVRIVNQHLGQ